MDVRVRLIKYGQTRRSIPRAATRCLLSLALLLRQFLGEKSFDFLVAHVADLRQQLFCIHLHGRVKGKRGRRHGAAGIIWR